MFYRIIREVALATSFFCINLFITSENILLYNIFK
nr:MAG TPA: hypothetical protein [Caudoviricetes sp.]